MISRTWTPRLYAAMSLSANCSIVNEKKAIRIVAPRFVPSMAFMILVMIAICWVSEPVGSLKTGPPTGAAAAAGADVHGPLARVDPRTRAASRTGR